MKDVFGKQLELGDQVATNIRGYTCDLIIAEVMGFTAQKVRLVYMDRSRSKPVEFLKYPSQLAIGAKDGLAGQEEKEA